MKPFLALIERDLRLALRQGSAIGTALGFYLIAVSIIPLGLGPDLVGFDADLLEHLRRFALGCGQNPQ